MKPTAIFGAMLAATLVLAGCSGGAGGTGDTGEASTGGESGQTAASWADSRYGTFEPLSQTGAGDTVITLPEGAAAGIVTATHDGAANFIITGLDESNTITADMMVNTIGAYTGVTAFGLQSIGAKPIGLQVTADGNWTITVSPVSAAAGPGDAGVGDAAYLYEGDAATMTATHDGAANFVVTQYDDSLMGVSLHVNEIGQYQGTVPFKPGPSFVTVKADGNWVIGAA